MSLCLTYGSALSPSPICSSYSCPFASLVYVKRVDLYSETDQVGLHTQFISRGEAHGNYLSLLCRRADGGHLCASHTERIPCNGQRDVFVFYTALTCCEIINSKSYIRLPKMFLVLGWPHSAALISDLGCPYSGVLNSSLV